MSLFGGSIAVLYFATYAASQIYRLLPQTASFLVMVLITVLACLTAITYESQALAILGLIVGFGTPVLLSTGQDNYMVLFSYMTLLNFGILGISFKKRWVVLQYTGFAVTWILFSAWYGQYHYVLPRFCDELSRFWAALFGIGMFCMMTLEVSAFFHSYLSQARFAAISIVWTLFAMVVMVLGFKKNSDIMRKVTLGFLFITVFKVFLFNISRISTPYRILSFIVLGLILVFISYLYTKAKQRLLETQAAQKEAKR